MKLFELLNSAGLWVVGLLFYDIHWLNNKKFKIALGGY